MHRALPRDRTWDRREYMQLIVFWAVLFTVHDSTTGVHARFLESARDIRKRSIQNTPSSSNHGLRFR